MADRCCGTLYIGVSSDIAARVWAHCEGRGSKFCARAWKLELIERANPNWSDLLETINA